MAITPRIFSRSNPSPHGETFKWVKIKTNFIGFHKYEDAPEEVAFLRYLHRHKFYVEALIQVFHDDRELEFFIVQNNLDRDIIPFVTQKFPLGSCEMISEDIMWGLVNSYGDHRNYYVEVSEDDENSATSAWSPYNQPHWATGDGEINPRKAPSSET